MSDFRVSNVLANNMVLQRHRPVRLWGMGKKAGDTVKATFGVFCAEGTVDSELYWELFLPPMDENKTPQVLYLTDGDTEIELRNIVVGDVWLIQGQSNAEMSVGWANSSGHGLYKDDIYDGLEDLNIRATIGHRSHAINAPDRMLAEQFDLVAPEALWQEVNKVSAQGLSAMGYFFAKKLAEELSGEVPIGLVVTASSGSPLLELMPQHLADSLHIPTPQNSNHHRCGMYNVLLSPVKRYTLRGMIYYQGESDQGDCAGYAEQLPLYFEELRNYFGKDMPIYSVQLSSHCPPTETYWKHVSEMRFTQEKLAKQIDNLHLIVSMDYGSRPEEKEWAHPARKKPVGERAALAALAFEYNRLDAEYSCCPILRKYERSGDNAKLYFDYVGGGLCTADGLAPLGFEAEQNGEFSHIDAEISDKNEITVKNFAGGKLRYANRTEIEDGYANIRSSSGLPLAAFEIEI